MNFSPASLLKLQRLARAIKKNLKQPVEMSSTSGMEKLLRIASIESNDQNVIALYNDFIATLGEQEKAELSTHTVSGVVSMSPSINEPQHDRGEEREHIRQRTYRGVVIGDGEQAPADSELDSATPETRKIKGMYRGQPIYEDGT